MTDIKYLSIVGQDLEYNLMFNRFCMPEYTSILCERDSPFDYHDTLLLVLSR
jgi:hypothetical protein